METETKPDIKLLTVTVKNLTDNDILDVKLLNEPREGIEIGYNDESLLTYINENPSVVGATYIHSNNDIQIHETIKIERFKGTPTEKTYYLIPKRDPAHECDSPIAISFRYHLDKATQLTVSKILPNATVSYDLYFEPNEE